MLILATGKWNGTTIHRAYKITWGKPLRWAKKIMKEDYKGIEDVEVRECSVHEWKKYRGSGWGDK